MQFLKRYAAWIVAVVLLFVLVLAWKGVYEVKGSSRGFVTITNRFTGKVRVIEDCSYSGGRPRLVRPQRLVRPRLVRPRLVRPRPF